MVIYMQHEKHGRMPVYSSAEALTHEKNGWSRFEFAPVEAPVEVPVEVPAVESEETEFVARRRGRPPKER